MLDNIQPMMMLNYFYVFIIANSAVDTATFLCAKRKKCYRVVFPMQLNDM